MIKARNIRGIVIGSRRGILVRVKRREMGVPSASIGCLIYWIVPILTARVELS
jgi:hypothetical protein